MTGMILDELRTIAAGGESASVEYKTSTAQLPRAGETLCGMLNGSGGCSATMHGGVGKTKSRSAFDWGDLDHEEILRTRDDAIRFRRISAGTSLDVGVVLDRLGLRRDGELTQAAQVLYGTRFLPDYPQAKLKLGRFRGTKITGDILDNKQEYYHAFAAVPEAMAFLDRTLPLSGHFVTGRIQREDRLPVPRSV